MARYVSNNRLGARQLQDSPVPNLKLEFNNKLCVPIFTGRKVKGYQCLPVLVLLKDALTGQVVNSRPESSAKLEVVVLHGDFAHKDDEWTADDFKSHVVKEREGKGPLLTGDLTITLEEGVGTLGDLTFTDNSSWTRSKMFRIGVRVSPRFADGMRIKECKTEAFTVKDQRGVHYKKHYPPQLDDEVWRLENIAKEGAFHRKLLERDIKTVQDFLKFYVMEPREHRNILGGMAIEKWNATVQHAKTCVMKGKVFVYYTDESRTLGIVFNGIFEPLGVINNNFYHSLGSVKEYQKDVDKLVKTAYANWKCMIEYDDVASMYGTNDNNSLPNIENENSMEPQEHAIIYNQLMDVSQPATQFPALPTSTNIRGSIRSQPYGCTGQEFPDSSYTYHGTQMIQGTDVFVSRNEPQVEPSSSISLQNNLFSTMGPSCTGLQIMQGDPSDWQGLVECSTTSDMGLAENLFREQAVEMLNHGNMQNLLSSPSMMRTENFWEPSEESSGFDLASPSATCFNGSHLSRKACLGWLKVKLALRWGIFIRKVAAKKNQRACLEEIE
ncbi:hypothetical protein KP509_12G041100 [Ceratopteris richardii]|uniref:Calmodulin-binding protein n=1 Tax=Ceratopteris richardii TaxID=49495 RepID=A0A8T2TKY0_CERRI|nr:hypothetical protein KP509_12G041100 [Ceratopteris richardii]